MSGPAVLSIADVATEAIVELLSRFDLELVLHESEKPIPGSYWGEREAGIIGRTVHVRADTPIHSLLHETCHLICMDSARRAGLDRDAGGDDTEESAVCYLQILLADELPAVGKARLMADMDAWGYSFRLGSTAAWFEEDADDALTWLVENGLVSARRKPSWRLRN